MVPFLFSVGPTIYNSSTVRFDVEIHIEIVTKQEPQVSVVSWGLANTVGFKLNGIEVAYGSAGLNMASCGAYRGGVP